MKKIIVFLAIIVGIFVALFAVQNYTNKESLKDNPYGKNDLQQPTIDLLNNKNYKNIILPDELKEKINEEEKVVAYFFSPTCSYCKSFTPKLMPIAEEMDVYIHQMNVLEFPEQMMEYKIESTPTLLYFENGKERGRAVGELSEEETLKFFDATILKK